MRKNSPSINACPLNDSEKRCLKNSGTSPNWNFPRTGTSLELALPATDTSLN